MVQGDYLESPEMMDHPDTTELMDSRDQKEMIVAFADQVIINSSGYDRITENK